MTLDLAVCTVISKPGLAGARVLAEAVRRQHPDSRVFVLLADRRDRYFAPDREAFELVELPDLRLHDLARLCFAYCPPELRAALQPRFLRHLLFERGVPKLLYLDPRVLVLGDLRPLAGLLEEHSVLLFPESADAERPVRKGSEDQALLAEGVYTTRVMGLRADARARHLLEWWGRRVQDVRAADEDAESVEQPWLALVPARFDGVRVVHEAGHAVPPDGGRARRVEIRSEGVVIDGERVHLLPVDTAVDCLPPAAGLSLAERHDERLLAAGRAETEQWPFAFGCLDNGVPIGLEVRRLYRELGDATVRFGDPFRAGRAGSFAEWLREEVHAGSGVSQFWYWIHGRRPDLSRVFPDVLGADRSAFLHWVGERGHREYSGGAAFDPPADAGLRPASTRPDDGGRSEALPGINLVGYARSEKGLGEALRGTQRALAAASIAHCIVDFPDTGSANVDRTLAGVLKHNPYPVNVIHVTADQLPYFVVAQGTGFLRGKYNVGFWLWELPELPPASRGSFAYVDEVWVPSTFCLEAISRVSPVPVAKIPLPLPAEGLRTKGVGREHFGLPTDSLVFLFIFDVHSTLARKNPHGVIQAFKDAFPAAEDARLVLKLVHGDHRIRRALHEYARDDRVVVMDRVLEREELYSLIELSDCYVSLHRSEGFGLTIAEAMALAKPIIATAYSANLDFMDATNSLLVRHELVRLEKDHPPYPRGGVWADPDLAQAAEFMRWVYENRDAARDLGRRAAKDIWKHLAPAAVGERIVQRLQLIRVRLDAGDFGRLVGR